jgi:hypothetical protein
VPLEFLKRKGAADAPAPVAPAPARTSGLAMPEEVVAQDHQLKLYYAGKSSEGVRMKSGPKALAELPGMLQGLAQSEIEVVAPLPIEFSQATPTIARPSEAMQWLNAHHVHSPITRHALVVLESIDAIDLAFARSSARARRRGRHRRLPRVQRDRQRASHWDRRPAT